MTDAGEPPAGTVAALRRPPVRQATTVRSDVDHTFDVFVRTIGVWWPVQPFSAGGDRVRDVTVEPFLQGRVYETWADGTVVDWGRLQVWEPPVRFAMTWTATPAVTEVELTFTALGPALTRDCALPGGYRSGAYSQGWTNVLGAFAAAVEAGGSA